MKNRKVTFAVVFFSILLLFISCSKAVKTADVPQDKKLFSTKDLPNATIALYSGTPIHNEVLKQYPGANLVFINNTPDMLLYTKQGKADCFIINKSEYMPLAAEDPSVMYTKEGFTTTDMALMFSKTKNDVKEEFNNFIAKFREEGGIDALEEKWIINCGKDCSIDRTFTGEKGVLKVATEALHAPFSYIYNGEIVGFDIELITKFGQACGYRIEIENSGWDPMYMGVLNYKYDIGCGNIMYTEERAAEANFSDIYYSEPSVIVYVNPDIRPFSAFSGKRIGVITGSIFDQAIDSHEEIENPELYYFSGDPDLLNALITNKIDAGVTDYLVAAHLQNSGKGIKIASQSLFTENSAFVLSKGNPLGEKINEVIQKFKEDGTIDALMEKWTNADDSTKTIEQDWEGANGTFNYAALIGAVPLSFMGSDGNPAGIDTDIILAVARELDYKVSMQLMDISGILSSISSGKADVGGGGIAVTEERKKSLDFSDILYLEGVILFVADNNVAESDGFFTSLGNSFERTFITEGRWKLFLEGCLSTVGISVIAIIIGTFLGFALYMACRNGNTVVNKIADIYLWFINGIPVVVLLMILYYIIFGKSSLKGLWISSIGFSFIFAAGVLGMLKTGVSAVDKGQEEGGLALGYTPLQTFFKIILPQAARVFMPSYINEVVQIIKATAVVGYIAVQDITKVSDLVRSRTYEPFFPLIASAVMYFILSWVLTLAFKWVLKKIMPTEDRNVRAQYLKGVER